MNVQVMFSKYICILTFLMGGGGGEGDSNKELDKDLLKRLYDICMVFL